MFVRNVRLPGWCERFVLRDEVLGTAQVGWLPDNEVVDLIDELSPKHEGVIQAVWVRIQSRGIFDLNRMHTGGRRRHFL